MRRGRHPDQRRRDDRTVEINLLPVIIAPHLEAGAVAAMICQSADLLSLSLSLVVEHPTEPLALAELVLTRIRSRRKSLTADADRDGHLAQALPTALTVRHRQAD
jgi:hypothetical protein